MRIAGAACLIQGNHEVLIAQNRSNFDVPYKNGTDGQTLLYRDVKSHLKTAQSHTHTHTHSHTHTQRGGAHVNFWFCPWCGILAMRFVPPDCQFKTSNASPVLEMIREFLSNFHNWHLLLAISLSKIKHPRVSSLFKNLHANWIGNVLLTSSQAWVVKLERVHSFQYWDWRYQISMPSSAAKWRKRENKVSFGFFFSA